MGSAHPFSVSFAPCFQGILCRSRLFFRMFLDKLFQICADRFIVKQKRRCFSPFLLSPSSRRAWIEKWQCDAVVYDRKHRRPPHGEHTSNPLSIRLHSPSFLQAGHRFGGQQPFSMQTSGGTAFCDPAADLFCVSSLLQAPTVQTAEDAARRGEHIGHLIFLHDSGQIPAVAVITQQADPAELCCKVHLLR